MILGAVRRPDHRGDCVMEVGDGDLGMEDADSDIVPGMFSISEDTVYRARGFGRFHILAGTVLCRGYA